MKIALIDHFDSFTYNLKALCEKVDPLADVNVFEPVFNQKDLVNFAADLIVIGPGPGTATDYPKSLEVVKRYYGKTPIFGVCLGLQLVNEFLGGKTKQSIHAMHGKISRIKFIDPALAGVYKNNFHVMRYHSLYVDLAPSLKLLAVAAEDQLPMMVSGDNFLGLQYHPESFASDYGIEILRNFIDG